MPAGDAAGSFFGGLLQGKSQGREQKVKNEYLESQKAYVKAQAKALDAKLEQDAREDAWWSSQPADVQAQRYNKGKEGLAEKLAVIQKMFGAGQAPVAAPPYDPGVAPGTGPTRPGVMSIPDAVAQGQVGGLGISREELLQGILKKELGVDPIKYNRTAIVEGNDGNPWVVPMNDRGVLDMSKAMPAPIKMEMQKGVGEGMAPTETPTNPYNRKPVGAPIQTGPPPTMQGQAATPGGGTAPYVMPMFGGGGGAKAPGGTGGLRTKLDIADTPIDEAAARMYRMPDGSMPKVGIDTPKQIFAKGGKLVSAKTLDIEGPIKVVGELVDQLDGFALGPDGIFTGIKPGMFNRAARGASDQVKSFMQTTGRGEKIALYEGYKQAFAGSLARTVMFEVGVMTDQDIARAVKAVPVILPIPDTEDVAKAKLKLIRGFIGNLDSVKDRKSMETALSRLESGVKALKKPDLSLGKGGAPKTWQDYKKAAGGQ